MPAVARNRHRHHGGQPDVSTTATGSSSASSAPYGACLRTRFNGFDSVLTVEVAGPPVLATRGYD
jgi:hypothetical protein